MRFRPCIDLRDGHVTQIVGGTLSDAAGAAGPTTNFVAALPSAHFAALYARDALPGGHVIMLGGGAANEAAALAALRAFPGGLQLGGGVTPDNAARFLEAGASHVIVTSFVFREGRIDRARLAELERAVGRARLVLDLSCRKRAAAAGGFEFVVMTDRWQTWTDTVVTPALLADLGAHCAELLVHAVDVEGLRAGVDEDLIRLLAAAPETLPVTYAGGVRNLADVERVRVLGDGRVDVSIGSALDIFGGDLPYADCVAWARAQEAAKAE
jgi:phosphoribosylformimino-5-aminoimidazole carboxamide ribotide isomerase